MRGEPSWVIRLPDSESEIIQHRLDVPDCIADALVDGCYPEPSLHTREEVIDAAEELLNMLPRLPAVLTDLQNQILFDCCDGSTFVVCAASAYGAGKISTGKWSSINRAASSLEKRMSKFLDLKVQIPRY